MSGRADVAGGSFSVTHDPAPRSGFSPAPMAISQWVRQSYLELGALPSAVPSARLHARLVVGEWGLEELADAVELIVSELVTNGIQAAEGLIDSWWQGRWMPGVPPVRLWLQADDSRVLIQVWDGSDQMPERQEPEPRREGGRGLLLVETLSARAGTYMLDGSSGKVVWAETMRQCADT
jgi:anti-sigma regulatory factor (Ser/Thr protein kinase)